MTKRTRGIHHITAVVGDPQENVDFYAGILGLRLVKKTINFDDTETYHLYFGNDGGSPGTIMTFFPGSGASKGEIGRGQVGVISFVVPKGALSFWRKRLEKYHTSYLITERFGEKYLEFYDPHGLHLELVERDEGQKSKWTFGGITPDVAIKGFGGATLLSGKPASTSNLLEYMGLEKIGEEGNMVRFKAIGDIGNVIDLKVSPISSGKRGAGTVHHIAWRAENDEDQLHWKSYIEENGYYVTPVKQRNYFNAIYFREHGGILFEIATDPPGFSHDESAETMGEKLMLPEWYESQRAQIERGLLPFKVREI